MPTLEDLQPFVIEPTPEPVTPPKETKADRAEQNRLFAELLAESAAVERIDELVIDDSLIDDFMKAMQQPEVAKATLRFVAPILTAGQPQRCPPEKSETVSLTLSGVARRRAMW